MLAALLARPGLLAGGVAGIALIAAIGVQQVRITVAQSQAAEAIAQRDLARMAAAECSAGVEALQADARKRAQEAARALAAARAASATRAPAIAALAQAETAPAPAGGALTCTDAVQRVRDALQ